MDLFRSMQVFVATVEKGSMSAAAAQLGISSAMVGQHIAALEVRMKTRLLNRTTRRQSLTDFGANYFEQCKDILDRIAITDLEAEAQQSEALGKLRVTAPSTFGATVLMPALARYREESPLVDLDIVLTDRNVDLVDEGFDFAFRIGVPPDSRLIARKLMPYTMAICAAPCYLSVKGQPAHPLDLSAHNMVSFTPAAGSVLTLSKGEELVKVTPNCPIKVNSGHALLTSALAGLGVVVQPKILLAAAIKEGTLVELFPDWQLGERHVSLLYYRDQRMTPRMRSFISFSLAAFG